MERLSLRSILEDRLVGKTVHMTHLGNTDFGIVNHLGYDDDSITIYFNGGEFFSIPIWDIDQNITLLN